MSEPTKPKPPWFVRAVKAAFPYVGGAIVGAYGLRYFDRVVASLSGGGEPEPKPAPSPPTMLPAMSPLPMLPPMTMAPFSGFMPLPPMGPSPYGYPPPYAQYASNPMLPPSRGTDDDDEDEEDEADQRVNAVLSSYEDLDDP